MSGRYKPQWPGDSGDPDDEYSAAAEAEEALKKAADKTGKTGDVVAMVIAVMFGLFVAAIIISLGAWALTSIWKGILS